MGSNKHENFLELSCNEKNATKISKEKGKSLSNASFLRWFKPLINALKNLGGSATPQEAREQIIKDENLSSDIVNEIRGKTKVKKFQNEVAFARNYLVMGGYIDKKVRGIWSLTEKGKIVNMTDELASQIFHDGMETIKNKKRKIQDDVAIDKDIVFEEYVSNEEKIEYPKYNKKDFLDEVFIDENKYDTIVNLLENKKNIILQGAPGVGKTFVAKKLAYSMMGVMDSKRVKMVQFHQSYTYEDFIMGFRPCKNGFEIKKGTFYNFCKEAEIDIDNDYFFIIDEINRGNLSKIFGELFMLIEGDKRGKALQLLYSDETFSVPKNVYIIGLMNTADRSIAMLDYALRRRFAFFELEPAFKTDSFKKYLKQKNNKKLEKLINTIEQLNIDIEKDETLGRGFRIGHSYFCKKGEIDDMCLNSIVNYELIPLINEYWFDEITKVREWEYTLREAIK